MLSFQLATRIRILDQQRRCERPQQQSNKILLGQIWEASIGNLNLPASTAPVILISMSRKSYGIDVGKGDYRLIDAEAARQCHRIISRRPEAPHLKYYLSTHSVGD